MVLPDGIVQILRLPQLNIKASVGMDVVHGPRVGIPVADGDLIVQAVQISGASN